MRLFFLTLLIPINAIALYDGNPSLPMMPEHGFFISKEDWLGLKIGYLFDYVYDRKLRLDNHIQENSRKKVKKYDSLSNFGSITLNFNDRVEVYGLLGCMSSTLKQKLFSNTTISYHCNNQLAWGVGGRAIVAYWGDLQFSVDAQYEKSDPNLSSLKVNSTSYSTKHANVDYTQWQIGIGISYRFEWIIPYIGVNYADFREKISHINSIKFLIPNNQVTFKNSEMFGIFFGLGFAAPQAFQVNLEARFINENAISISTDFKF